MRLKLGREDRSDLNREKRREDILGGRNILSKTTEAKRSMDHLDRGGYDLSVQKREKKFRNKEREKCMKENIRSNYLLSQK